MSVKDQWIDSLLNNELKKLRLTSRINLNNFQRVSSIDKTMKITIKMSKILNEYEL